MIRKRFSRYFWHNMRLFTSIFYVICILAAILFFGIMIRNQQEMLEIRYQNAAESSSTEIDGRLKEIRKLVNDISMITWVKKLSTSSEVFLQDFTDIQRLECQAELSRYLAADHDLGWQRVGGTACILYTDWRAVSALFPSMLL